ncbi:hypothetical protein HGRIS_002387 [Hohenbuehelia grisea]|uniref:Ubiquinol-cytochrome c chaperone domain-containing protein n=1 Tax=Hohenbuehelia grisea TaxID=104357 RepID=A0ABR3JME4_9AGAR
MHTSRSNLLRASARRSLQRPTCSLRYVASAPQPSSSSPGEPSKPKSSSPRTPEVQQTRQKTWLTRQIESSPAALAVFRAVAKSLGYGSPQQVMGRRAFVLYEEVCAIRADKDQAFWKDECSLPPTFQSWFTITNLHVWLMTVRLRALPQPHGKAAIQGLIDHFFIDVEDRVRAVLQPRLNPPAPYTFSSPFYTKPSAPKSPESENGKQKAPSRAPDRIVSRQMKIFKEQWAGMGLALDLGLVRSDMEMAGAIWRNILGARGARGIMLPTDANGVPHFRRSVNLVGGEVVNVAKVDFEKEEQKDDGSGVHDFAPQEADKYVAYPELMFDLVAYARRELVRLESLSDAEIMKGDVQKLHFGRVRKQ